jgi:uncharacterized protein (TIGR00251 family)
MGAVMVDQAREGGVFRVKVQPAAKKTEVKGEHGGALKVSVAAAPEKGRANEELVRFLARALGLGKGTLEVVSGETSREKRVLARGVPAADVAARLAALERGGEG